MKVLAPAKVNIALDVVGKMENGYHELDMIMAPISLFDELNIQPIHGSEDIILCDGAQLPEKNTIQKSIDLMRNQYAFENHYLVEVKKSIPMQAGLAGGSADAAAVLKAINEIEKLNLTEEILIDLGKRVGADVPFCLVNEWARVQGIGEKIRRLNCDWKFDILLVKPKEGVSTPASFSIWDSKENKKLDVDIVEEALVSKNVELLYTTMVNDLEPIGQELLPVLNTIKEDMNDLGIVRVMMSGSGSSMMGFSVDQDVLDEAKKVLKDRYEFVEVVTVG